jgi:hypothetical protein
MRQAYSRLKHILQQHHWTLDDLRKRLEATGVRAGTRSLARLSDETTPLERLDLRLASAICEVCEVPLSGLIVFHKAEDGFRRLSAAKQKRLDYLMDGNNNGTLTEAELEELRRMARECEEMTLHNSELLASQLQEAAS